MFHSGQCAVQCGNSGCLANVESLGGWVEESLLVSGRSMLSLVFLDHPVFVIEFVFVFVDHVPVPSVLSL